LTVHSIDTFIDTKKARARMDGMDGWIGGWGLSFFNPIQFIPLCVDNNSWMMMMMTVSRQRRGGGDGWVAAGLILFIIYISAPGRQQLGNAISSRISKPHIN